MEHSVNVRIPASLWAAIRELAINERRSATSQLAVLVERGILATGSHKPPSDSMPLEKRTRKQKDNARRGENPDRPLSPEMQLYVATQAYVHEHGTYPPDGWIP